MLNRILQFFDKILTFFEEWTLFITVIVALVALFFNVVLRYGFNYSLTWSEELVREVIIYTTFIGCSAALKRNSMIKIDASVQLFPRLRIPFTFFSNFFLIFDAGDFFQHSPHDSPACWMKPWGFSPRLFFFAVPQLFIDAFCHDCDRQAWGNLLQGVL